MQWSEVVAGVKQSIQSVTPEIISDMRMLDHGAHSQAYMAPTAGPWSTSGDSWTCDAYSLVNRVVLVATISDAA